VRSITPGDADDFKQWLVAHDLAPTTIHKRLQFARTFFRAMLRRKIIRENPFEDVKSPAAGVQDRQRFLTRDEITRVLEACPDHHWRVITKCGAAATRYKWWGFARLVRTACRDTSRATPYESQHIAAHPPSGG
jgi:hypothetical protein